MIFREPTSVCRFRLQREEPPHSPRLFECSNQTGRFRMTEVYDFAQSDLDEEDVMLLDTWEEVRGQVRWCSSRLQDTLNVTTWKYICKVSRVCSSSGWERTELGGQLDIVLFFLCLTLDFPVGWELCQPEGDQRSVELCPRLPEDPPSRPWLRHTYRLYQTGLRTAHLHWLVQCLGSS